MQQGPLSDCGASSFSERGESAWAAEEPLTARGGRTRFIKYFWWGLRRGVKRARATEEEEGPLNERGARACGTAREESDKGANDSKRGRRLRAMRWRAAAKQACTTAENCASAGG
jgi:hypothetical protein